LSAGLAELAAEVRRDLERLNHPPPNWPLPVIGPDGRAVLDALVVGAGMCGETAAFALIREGVRNIRVIDRAPRGREGPWGTFARMETLRSPKHLTGPDLGVPSLTYRAWYEAEHGAEGWEALYKIDRLDWRDYLLWVRDTIGLAVENETALEAIEAQGSSIRARLDGPGGNEEVFARQVILASGRDGAGGLLVPSFPSLTLPDRHGRVFHSAEDIDFERFRGGRVAVLGASASAFDNAATALEAGAAAVVMDARRPHLPQVNKSRWMAFPGYQRGFALLDDATRWRFLTYAAGEPAPPPHESVLRCERHAGFSLRFGQVWHDVESGPDGVTIHTAAARERFDAAILGTGFAVDVARRPELAPFAGEIALWADRVGPEEARQHPELAAYPYLGPGFEFVERAPGRCPALSRLRLFNHGATASHGALAGDIPGLGVGATRVAQAVAHALFVEDIERHYANLVAYEEPELEPTRYYVPRADRRPSRRP
jgi:cation diffusion facilitator CzcD-associated flavoprotein CzcO